MTKCIVKSPLRHNGKRREIGEQVELSDSEAKRLEAQGVVEPIVDKPPAKPPRGKAKPKNDGEDGE